MVQFEPHFFQGACGQLIISTTGWVSLKDQAGHRTLTRTSTKYLAMLSCMYIWCWNTYSRFFHQISNNISPAQCFPAISVVVHRNKLETRKHHTVSFVWLIWDHSYRFGMLKGPGRYTIRHQSAMATIRIDFPSLNRLVCLFIYFGGGNKYQLLPFAWPSPFSPLKGPLAFWR